MNKNKNQDSAGWQEEGSGKKIQRHGRVKGHVPDKERDAGEHRPVIWKGTLLSVGGNRREGMGGPPGHGVQAGGACVTQWVSQWVVRWTSRQGSRAEKGGTYEIATLENENRMQAWTGKARAE